MTAPNGLSDFVHHLETYLPLFRQLSEFRMLYISRSDSHFARATRNLRLWSSGFPLNRTSPRSCCATSACAKLWDEKRYAAVTDAELIFRNQARSRFKGAIFDAPVSRLAAWGWLAQRPSGSGWTGMIASTRSPSEPRSAVLCRFREMELMGVK